MSRSKAAAISKRLEHRTDESSPTEPKSQHGQASRETVESIVVAVILAFLFRAFVAEAFVIPTGSMAPTLMGQHKDVECPECGCWYRAGASIEINDEETQSQYDSYRRQPQSTVVATTCPICRYRKVLDLYGNANHATFSGDRILVSKFIYEFVEPDRWDVIVFKFPMNAKQNFIKRLIGRPNETVLIRQGDIFIRRPGEPAFKIARKPDKKLDAMLQLVHDSRYVSQSLQEVGWPLRWQPWAEGGADVSELWASSDGGRTYQTSGDDRDIWLRYHHIVPSDEDWELIEEGGQPELKGRRGQLITDFYAYNAFTSVFNSAVSERTYDPAVKPEEYTTPMFGRSAYSTLGLNWVGDLALECDVEVESNEGELLLRLDKGGIYFLCRIDISTGVARLEMRGGPGRFISDDGATSATNPEAKTKLQGAGSYAIRYANVDAEIGLWVNGSRVTFDGPTTYQAEDLCPTCSEADPGDLAPLGIGSRSAKLDVRHLRVQRDIYYVASRSGHEYMGLGEQAILASLDDPTKWKALFARRGELYHSLGPDQFFPLGDNSPQSSDARMWHNHHYFERELLIGRALLIYWPHPWYRPIPYFPNFKRMRLIH